MKIVDTFMFCNEYDMLELRFNEHYAHVDKFVIVECDNTYTGIYKGYNLEKHKDRYSQWWDKVEYIKIEGSPIPNEVGKTHTQYGYAWTNEYWQRDHMALGWKNLSEDDVVLVSDLDEILRPEALKFIRDTNYGFYLLNMPMFYFRMNYMDCRAQYQGWGKAYRGYFGNPSKMRDMQSVPGKTKVVVEHAGWHFSWHGDDEFIKNKLKSFAHTEFDRDDIHSSIDIEKAIENHTDHIRPQNKTWFKVIIDQYYPKTVLYDFDKYSKWFLPGGTKTVQEYYPYKIMQYTEFPTG
jgi:hypothetical protein